MRTLLASLALALTTSTALAQSDIYETEQADFRITTLAEGLEHPWGMAFLPGGDMLVSEREGALRYIEDGELRDAPIAGLPDLYVEGQGGLLGLAVHPDFANNRWVYFAFSAGETEANGTALGRGRLSEDGSQLTEVETLFRVSFEKQRGYHFGGRILFNEDGTLLLTLGEGSRYEEEAQNLANHLGTIVRLNDDGSVPFDNPYVSSNGALPEIYSYGHRNVQGIARHPDTGTVWAHEHGPRGGDEINLLSAGTNYGWPTITYGINYDGTPITDQREAEGMAQPIWFWDPSIAPSGMSFYQGDAFPNWQGDVLIGALAGTHLARLEVDGDRVISEEAMLTEWGERIRDVATGPDGHVYLLTDDFEGRLVRLDPVTP
ncbi:PQQ-dependent sugar dehydrogenase [Maricaulis sp. CAU 1757]